MQKNKAPTLHNEMSSDRIRKRTQLQSQDLLSETQEAAEPLPSSQQVKSKAGPQPEPQLGPRSTAVEISAEHRHGTLPKEAAADDPLSAGLSESPLREDLAAATSQSSGSPPSMKPAESSAKSRLTSAETSLVTHRNANSISSKPIMESPKDNLKVEQPIIQGLAGQEGPSRVAEIESGIDRTPANLAATTASAALREESGVHPRHVEAAKYKELNSSTTNAELLANALSGNSLQPGPATDEAIEQDRAADGESIADADLSMGTTSQSQPSAGLTPGVKQSAAAHVRSEDKEDLQLPAVDPPELPHS